MWRLLFNSLVYGECWDFLWQRECKGTNSLPEFLPKILPISIITIQGSVSAWPLWGHVHSKLASKVFWAHTPTRTMHSLGILVLSIIEMNKVPANSIGVSVQCWVDSTRHGLSLLGEAKYTSRDVGLLDSVRLTIVYAIQPWSQTHQSKLPFSTTPNR